MTYRGSGLSRRDVATAAALAAVAPAGASWAAAGRRPNFVVILADDLGAFDLSCYGRPDYRTPHIDGLAREGLRFDLAYASSSSCAPTRVALMSGRYQNRLPIGTGIGGGYPSATIGYPGDLPSLPGILKRAGYRTALVGKWDLGEMPSFGPRKSGYDEFFGLMGGGIDYWTHDAPAPANPARRIPDLYEGERPVRMNGYATDLFTDRACTFIERSAATPFLLSLHYTAPHWPWQTRDDRGMPRSSDVHFDGGSPLIYRRMMEALDDGVGRVLATLRRLHLDRNTIVLFTSDNGGERFSKMWPLRGGKGDLWEGGIRVPLIVRWPGRIARGATTRQVALSMDVLPTFAALAGASLDPSAPPDGIDLSPQLFGAAPAGRTVFWKTPGDLLAALDYPWKYLRLVDREFLFDLDGDATEHANLKLRRPDVFARLASAATAWSARMLPNLPGFPPSLQDRLEALDPPLRI